MKRLAPALIAVAACALGCANAQNFLDILSAFVDVDDAANETHTIFDLARQAFAEEKAGAKDASSAPVDDAYPLALAELRALVELHAACKGAQALALQTWCTGDATFVDEDDRTNPESLLCPPNVRTHPCSGRVLGTSSGAFEFLWPWEGVRCNAYTDPTTVTHIFLPDERLRCRLTDVDLSPMVSLEQLDLSRNELSGPFPHWLAAMPSLRFVNLSDNRLRGAIPLSFADANAFQVVDLSANELTAPTLRFFRAMGDLRFLDLSQNRIAGPLAPELFELEHLHTINVSHNRFVGSFPALPRPPRHIVAIDVSFNNFTGELPANLSLFGREDPLDPDEDSSLEVFVASANNFVGRLPNLSRLGSLRRFAVDHNRLTGDLPPSLFPRSTTALSLLGNQFACPIADFLAPATATCECSNVRSARNESRSTKGPDGCVYCAAGFFADASTSHECRACPAGTRSAARSSSSSSSNQEACAPCEPGTFGNESGKTACLECPRGSATNDTGKTACDPCLPGFYAGAVGSRACAPCDAGSFGGRYGLAVCEPCPPGSYAAVRGESACLPCPIGFFQRSSGETACEACAEGYVSPFPGHAACSACPAGSWFDRGRRTCRPCPPNTFTDASARTQCSACPVGTAADGVGNVACSAKPQPGFERADASSSPNSRQVACRVGFFNSGERLFCEPCPHGTFAAARGSHSCALCPRGTFARLSGSTRCEQAPPGTFTDYEGAWKPRRCPPNHVAPGVGSTGCVECPWPTFSLLGGGTSCASAGAGEVYDVVEWPRLTMALAGVSSQDLAEALNAGGSMRSLGSSWETTLAAYGVKSVELRLLAVEPQTPDDDLLLVEFALEALPRPLPRRHKRNSTAFKALKRQSTAFTRIAGVTRAAFERSARDFVATSGGSDAGSESSELQALVARPGFVESLVRQFHRDGVADVSASVVRVAVLADSPLRSSRSTPCPAGTYLHNDSDAGTRECRLCPVGTFSDAPGASACTLCARGTFADDEGLEQCEKCPSGDSSLPGAAECVTCGWFSYACEGFWQDVALALLLGSWLLAKLWLRCRGVVAGDTFVQEESERAALLAAVRAHGRTGASVRYAPMGEVSADTMLTSRTQQS